MSNPLFRRPEGLNYHLLNPSISLARNQTTNLSIICNSNPRLPKNSLDVLYDMQIGQVQSNISFQSFGYTFPSLTILNVNHLAICIYAFSFYVTKPHKLCHILSYIGISTTFSLIISFLVDLFSFDLIQYVHTSKESSSFLLPLFLDLVFFIG